MHRLRLISACASATLVASGAAAVTWPGNHHQYDVILASGIEWPAAAAAAEGLGEGWHLATITSAEENAFVASIIQGSVELWIGGFQDPATTVDPNANWSWITGEPWQYTAWAPPEPNDFYGPASEQHLATGRDGLWNDEGSAPRVAGYVLETPIPVPEPATLALLGAGVGACTIRRRAGVRGAATTSAQAARRSKPTRVTHCRARVRLLEDRARSGRCGRSGVLG